VKSKENPSNEDKEKRIKDNQKTTLDNINICVFCNEEKTSLNENYEHMKSVHNLDIPLEAFLKDIQGAINLIAKKIFTYKACLGCDSQNFETIWALQNHIVNIIYKQIDSKHIYINLEDLEDHLCYFYDKDKLSQVKDNNIRLTKAYKILKFKLKLKRKEPVKRIQEDDEEWEDEDSIEDPIELPNGELLLQSGKVLGNKYYHIYYKQRVKINRFEGVMSTREFEQKMRVICHLI
jgi:hypothetical protein